MSKVKVQVVATYRVVHECEMDAAEYDRVKALDESDRGIDRARFNDEVDGLLGDPEIFDGASLDDVEVFDCIADVGETEATA